MKTILTALLLFLFVSKSEAQDFSQIAPEYCDCYASLEDSIYVEYVQYILAASHEPQFSLAYFKAISSKGKDFAATGMKSWSHLKQMMADPKTEMGKCAGALNIKYAQHLTDDAKRQAFQLGILEELERTGECGFYAAVLRSIYRQSE